MTAMLPEVNLDLLTAELREVLENHGVQGAHLDARYFTQGGVPVALSISGSAFPTEPDLQVVPGGAT